MNLISSDILQYCGFLRFHSTLCRFIPQCFDFLNLTFIFILKMCDHFLPSFLKRRLTKAISHQGPSYFILVVHIKFINVNDHITLNNVNKSSSVQITPSSSEATF